MMRALIPNNKAIALGCLVLVLLVLFPLTSCAGVFGILSRLSKTVDNVDINLPLHKLNFPDNIRGLTPATIKPGEDGQWKIVQSDGSTTPIDNMLKRQSDDSSGSVFVVRTADLPDNMQQFDTLPAKTPILIQGKKMRIFELHRDKEVTLRYKNVSLPVKEISEIRDGLWMLQRPSFGRGVRFIQFENGSTSPLPSTRYASSMGVESIGTDQLIPSMRALKNQTVVLSGRVINGHLQMGEKGSIGMPVQKIVQAANDNDIRLVILESDKPNHILKEVSHSMEKALKDDSNLYDTAGDFFNHLRVPNSTKMLELYSIRSGENQIAVQWIAGKIESTSSSASFSTELLKHIPAHLLLQSTRIYVPDRERSRELDSRIIPGINSWVQFYVIISAILGFIVPGTSWKLWRKVWARDRRSEHQNIMVFLLSWLAHRILFLVLFIPILGSLSFLWLILSSIYKVINFILFRPTRWVFQKVMT